MTETLFERYKEALRAGHVAVVRGRFEEAAAAYREAGVIAPDRAVPRTALGGVCLRLGDPDAALAAYDAALAIAPDDDPSTLGRAQALVVLRRTADAAATYDHLGEVRSAAGRTADAAEAARRALAIEPTDARRARHVDLVQELRVTAGAAAAEGAALEVVSLGTDDAAAARTAGEESGAAGEPGAGAAPGGPDPEDLIAALEDAAARGDGDAAADAALAAARAYRSLGHVTAAFDACLQGIGARPADVDLHLMLADLALDRGWTGRAGDIYRDLLRLVELDGDPVLGERVRDAAVARLPAGPRIAPA
jgi:tetratricopeptide (TPR) repeat protein